VWSATQVPHILRFAIAATTGIPESKVRVIAPDVGGGFGGKLQTTPEEFATLAVARKLGKPCKFTETRSETMVSAHHGRDQWQKLTLSAEKDGTVTGLKVELLADLGAYVAIVGGGVPVLGAWMFNAIYKFPAYQFNCQTVLTNKTWVDAYRGAGRPEATYAIERLMDELAVEVGVDPIAIREKNWITHDEFPFTTVAGMTYDSGNYEAATAKALELFGYDELRAEQKARRESGDPVQLGIGVSTFTEMCGLAPSRGARLAQLRRRRLGERQHPDARHRHRRGRLRGHPARPGPRDGVEPDRRRPARHPLRERRGAARRHPDRAQGPGHLRVALARRRR
jgi:carbon-monoxide dehydrogenase large subunit